MKRHFIAIVAVSLVLHISGIAAEDSGVKVTYIANEGFLLEGAGKKVLVDAVFGKGNLDFCDAPSPETLDRILSQHIPFDNVDLLLATHQHVDHFDPDLVSQYLIGNDRCKMIGTQQTIDRLRESDSYDKIKKQVQAITPAFGHAKRVTANGIELTVLRLQHCTYFVTDENTGKKTDRHRDVQNLGFIIHLGKHKILHTGDCGMESEEEFKNYKIDQERIDIAFLGLLFRQPCEPRIKIVNDLIKPQNIVLMHLRRKDKQEYFALRGRYQDRLAPLTIFEDELDSRVFTK